MLHSDVHVDRPLSNFAVEYKNQGYIADQVAPFIPVNNKSDTYMIYNKADRFSLPEDIRGPKAEANQTSWGSSTSTYGCIDRALKDFVPDAIVANSDAGVNPTERSTGMLVDLLLLNYEKRVSTLVMTSGNYPSGSYYTTLSGTTQLSDYTNSDPIGVIDTGKLACFYTPNTMVMNDYTFTKLKRHPQLLDKVKGGATTGDPATITLQQMKEIFEIENILIGNAKYNSGTAGQTATYTRVWGNHIMLAYLEPGAGLNTVTAFATFRWTQPTTGAGYKVRRYRDEKRGGGGWEIEAEMSVVEKAICTDLAYLVVDAVA